jgi:hypothetical protein
MDAQAFIDKWKKSTRSERSAAHEHFLDLCTLVGHPLPGESDPTGQIFTTEKLVKKASGGRGFADVFKKGVFAWEYKKKGADLDDAFNQLLQYSGDLGNPVLLVASDMDRIVVRTHFNGYPTTTFTLTLVDLARPEKLELLRRVFFEPDALKPAENIAKITEKAARQLAEVAPSVRTRHTNPTRVAHFLDRLIFCLFAEDTGLLPGKVFTRTVEKFATRNSSLIAKDVGLLFQAMAHGGDVYGETIPHFDGNLFDDSPAIELNALEFQVVHEAAALDWSEMDPSIFGTLFERVMDPDQRSQLGAHYTGYKDIATLVSPVVMDPLRREWDAAREQVESLVPVAPERADPSSPSVFRKPSPENMARAKSLIDGFLKRLRTVRVLDPACGSGNFLYVALKMLKDLEYEVLVFCRRHDLPKFELEVGPHQLLGIEKNEYAHDLAQMTVWIGMIQWHRGNGFPYDRDPVLQPLDTIEHRDAILDLAYPDLPREPVWPEADFIVGNPPFLGGKKMRTELGDDYIDRLFILWRERVRPEADLCCYWFEKARHQIETRKCRRAGLLATQGIRGGANRETLHGIKRTGELFFAVSDRHWVLDGANVHVSLIGFDDGSENIRLLDGRSVPSINSNLTSAADITQAKRLSANLDTGFMGDTKGGKFDIVERQAMGFMDQPNPNGKPNSDVIVPWINGLDVTRRTRNAWIVDFGIGTLIGAAAGYERPFEHIKSVVYPERSKNKRQAYRDKWWIHVEPRPAMRAQLERRDRFIVTATVSKHRLFVWMEKPTLADHQLIAFSRSDDYFFGVLHSRPHEVWARAQGTQVRERESGFRYTPTSCFETFPFPDATPAQRDAIAAAAERLDGLRSNWLNPREWNQEEMLEFPGSVDGPWARFVVSPDARGIGTVRYPRLVAKSAFVFDLAKRTLTNLYNERPTWLDVSHRALDEAVFDAYGWDPLMSDEALLAALLELNLKLAEATTPVDPEPADE